MKILYYSILIVLFLYSTNVRVEIVLLRSLYLHLPPLVSFLPLIQLFLTVRKGTVVELLIYVRETTLALEMSMVSKIISIWIQRKL